MNFPEPQIEIQHLVPPGEENLHLHSEECECGPVFDSHAVPGFGAAFWYRHTPFFPVTSAPDTAPDTWFMGGRL